MEVPLKITLTKGMASPELASMTLPCTIVSCARRRIEVETKNRKNKNRKGKFLKKVLTNNKKTNLTIVGSKGFR